MGQKIWYSRNEWREKTDAAYMGMFLCKIGIIGSFIAIVAIMIGYLFFDCFHGYYKGVGG